MRGVSARTRVSQAALTERHIRASDLGRGLVRRGLEPRPGSQRRPDPPNAQLSFLPTPTFRPTSCCRSTSLPAGWLHPKVQTWPPNVTTALAPPPHRGLAGTRGCLLSPLVFGNSLSLRCPQACARWWPHRLPPPLPGHMREGRAQGSHDGSVTCPVLSGSAANDTVLESRSPRFRAHFSLFQTLWPLASHVFGPSR